MSTKEGSSVGLKSSVPELIEELTDRLADQVVAKIGPRLIAYLEENRPAPQPDPLLSASEAAKRLGISDTSVRTLVAGGYLKRLNGFAEIRIRQSEVDNYGKENPKRK